MKTTKSIKVAGRSVRVSNERSVKGIYTASLYHKGKQRWKSMDSTNLAVAESRARAWALAWHEEKWSVLQGVASKDECSTLGEIVDGLLSSGLVRDRSAREYERALLRLVAKAEGLAAGKLARPVRSSVLSGDLVDVYVAEMQGLRSPDYSKTVREGNNSINSTLANAKAVFGAKLMRHYAKIGLVLPVLDGFLAAPRVQAEPVGFRMPSDELLSDLVAKSAECETNGRTALYLVTQMMLCMGMDSSEVLASRGSWLEDGALVIRPRPEEGFQGKTANRGRRLAVPSHLLAYIAAAGEGFVVLPGGSISERRDLIYREHSQWLRTWFPKERYTKTNHSLRKLGGTLMADREGSARAGAMFLGNREDTFSKHYSGQRAAQCLELGDLVGDNKTGRG